MLALTGLLEHHLNTTGLSFYWLAEKIMFKILMGKIREFYGMDENWTLAEDLRIPEPGICTKLVIANIITINVPVVYMVRYVVV